MRSPTPARSSISATCPSFSPEPGSQITPRRIWSCSMDSNRARKLPSPKPSLPFLDDLEEDRTDDIAREDLQQHSLALLRIAIDEDAAAAQLGERLPMAGHARGEALIIGVGRVLERNPVPAQHVHRAVDVLGREGDVLDAFAVILAQVLLDLALVVLRLVDRDADLAARTGHGARQQPGALALDVEVADLAEAEQLLVEAGPDIHAPAADVVRQMVDLGKA